MNSRAFRASTSKSGDAIDAPMTPDISERAFEEAIECALLRHGPDACPDDAAPLLVAGAGWGRCTIEAALLRDGLDAPRSGPRRCASRRRRL